MFDSTDMGFYIVLLILLAYFNSLVYLNAIIISNIKYNYKSHIKYVAILLFTGVFLISLTCFFPDSFEVPYRIFINLLAWLLANIFVLKLQKVKALKNTLIQLVSVLVFETTVIFIFGIYKSVTTSVLKDDAISIELQVNLILTLCLVILQFIRKIKFRTLNTKFILLQAVIISVALAILPSVFIILLISKYRDFTIMILGELLLITNVTVAIASIISNMNLIKKIKQNETAQSQMNAVKMISDDYCMFKHNYYNMLYGFASYIEKSKNKELMDYYNQVVEKSHLVNNDNIISIQKIKNLTIFGLIVEHIEKAKKQNVNFTINLNDNFLHLWYSGY